MFRIATPPTPLEYVIHDTLVSNFLFEYFIKVFQQKNYTENFVQSILSAMGKFHLDFSS